MNPKIKQILDNSGIETKQDGAGYEYHRAWPEDMEKFAELIIKECINTIEEFRVNLDNEVEWKTGRPICNIYDLSQTIKEHFGVE